MRRIFWGYRGPGCTRTYLDSRLSCFAFTFFYERTALLRYIRSLKGHGNETDFLGFLQKLVPHRSLTLHFEPFRFWLRIRGDIRNRKTTPRLAESESRLLNVLKKTRQVRESSPPQLGESESHQLPNLVSRGDAMVSRGVAIQIF
jgi:hypothetical protein